MRKYVLPFIRGEPLLNRGFSGTAENDTVIRNNGKTYHMPDKAVIKQRKSLYEACLPREKPTESGMLHQLYTVAGIQLQAEPIQLAMSQQSGATEKYERRYRVLLE